MMKKLITGVLLLTTCFSFAQKGKPDTYGKTITTADLKKHLYIIAGPEMEGRETASEGQRKAAAYIQNHFQQLGLKPAPDAGYQQRFPLYQDTLLETNLEVNGQAFALDKDFNVAISTSFPAMFRFSEVVVIGGNAWSKLDTVQLAGKLVLVLNNAGSETRLASANRNSFLQRKGIAAVLMVSNQYPAVRAAARKSGMTIHAFKKAMTPQQFSISENVARSMLQTDLPADPAYVKTHEANVLLDIKKKTLELESTNVIGILEGSDLKDEYLVITAHYDHLGKRDTAIYYGADDDGSGTVGILELAEAFAKAKAAGKGPRRSIVFMAVSGEEKGLLGSEYYAAHPLLPLDKTTANLNIDMIGRIDPQRTAGDSTNYVYVIGDDKLSSDLRIISEAANKKYTKLELDYKYNDLNDPNFFYYRSDHYNFAKNGVPIIFYFNGTHADYHQPSDTPEKINYELLAKRAKLIFYTAWEMANRDAMLKRDLPLPELRR